MQGVKIYHRQINPNNINFSLQRDRLKLLFEGFNEGYILADNIFLDKKKSKKSPNSNYYDLYIIEPDFSSMSDKYVQLHTFLKTDPEFPIKKKIFENLLIIMNKIHESGLAHMSLNPKNIWIEGESIVYLRPFIVNLDEINEKVNESCLNNKFSSFYISPEETFISDYISKTKNMENLKKCDLWALGCLFFDIFCGNMRKSLFETSDPEEKLYKFFEILRFPDKKEIPFLDLSYYMEIKRILKKKMLKHEKLEFYAKNVGVKEMEILKKLLVFDPKKRCDVKEILKIEFFAQSEQGSIRKEINKKLFSSGKSNKVTPKSKSEQKNEQFSDEDLEFSKESKLSDDFDEDEMESLKSKKDPKKNEGKERNEMGKHMKSLNEKNSNDFDEDRREGLKIKKKDQKKNEGKHMKSLNERRELEDYDDFNENYYSDDNFVESQKNPKFKGKKKDFRDKKKGQIQKKDGSSNVAKLVHYNKERNYINEESYFDENYNNELNMNNYNDANNDNYSNKTFENEENDNSLLTAKEEWTDLAPIVTPKYDIMLSSLKKKKVPKEKCQDFSTKSMFVGSKEQSYELSTTNLSNFSRRKAKQNWFEIKIPRLFVFQSLRNSELSIELFRKTKKGGLIPQDSINFVIIF